MSSSHNFFTSSIGRKVLMALTGIALYLFVIGHLLGNLQVFLGPESFNGYAAALKAMPILLNAARIGLLAVVVVHIVLAFQLRQRNAAARPVDYKDMQTVQASAASLYMLHTGIIILIFVVLHLLHFTFGVLQPEYFTGVDAKGRHDAFAMLVRGFQHPLYSASYVVAMIFLAIHLSHAGSSLFQTLGFNHPRYSPCLRKGSVLVAILIAIGYCSIPLSVLLGIVA